MTKPLKLWRHQGFYEGEVVTKHKGKVWVPKIEDGYLECKLDMPSRKRWRHCKVLLDMLPSEYQSGALPKDGDIFIFWGRAFEQEVVPTGHFVIIPHTDDHEETQARLDIERQRLAAYMINRASDLLMRMLNLESRVELSKVIEELRADGEDVSDLMPGDEKI